MIKNKLEGKAANHIWEAEIMKCLAYCINDLNNYQTQLIN